MKKKTFFIGVIVLVTGIAGAVLYAASKSDSFSGGGMISSAGHLKGPQNAKVQIVEFSDFQCPACQKAQPILNELLEKYPEDVSLTFKHFPLEGHLWAKVAHQAAECGGRQGKFWEFHDLLFDNQANWSGPANPIEKFLRFAKQLGLDLEAFGSCISGQSVQKSVNAQREDGVARKVRSTPTMFIGEERIVGPVQLKVKGEEIIRKQLGLPPLEAKK